MYSQKKLFLYLYQNTLFLGGGRPPPSPPSTGVDRMLETILGPALEGLENPYDGDALPDINVSTCWETCPEIL